MDKPEKPEKTEKTEKPKPKLPRLFRVTISYDVIILAHTSKEAESYAMSPVNDVDLDTLEVSDVFCHKAKENEIDQDWMDSLPYIADDVKDPEHQKDCTVGEWFDKIKEENEQLKRDSEFQTKQMKLPDVT